MKQIAGILSRGTVAPDGKSYVSDFGYKDIIPLAEGFDPRPPGTEERFWEGETKVGYLWWKKTVRVAIPFEVVGWGPLGQ